MAGKTGDARQAAGAADFTWIYETAGEQSPFNVNANSKGLFPKQRDELLAALKARFDVNTARHPGLVWAKVQAC